MLKTYFHGEHLSLPIDLLIVRNAINEGSLRLKLNEISKYKYPLDKLKETHGSKWKLSPFGRLQAKVAGNWIKEHFPTKFDAYLTAEYLRSMETAARLDLPGSVWIPSVYLRSRDFGDLSSLKIESVEDFNVHMKERARDIFYWTPPNGESIAHLMLRTERVIHWIRKNVPPDGKALIVTNKDIMEALRIRMENIVQTNFIKAIANPPPKDVINTCSIIHYTRRNPRTGEVVPKYRWKRTVTPWMGKKFSPESFDDIVDVHYQNEDLLAEVSDTPTLF